MAKILDCTLRDGGYINDFAFGAEVITDIVDKLSRASVDIIECGFLRAGANDPDKSLFGSIGAVKKVIFQKNPKTMYVAMIQYGTIGIEDIEDFTGDSVDGIRVTFHEHEIEDAFLLGEQLKRKGYKVFMQPVGTMTYTDEALLRLIDRVNRLQPYAFYIVDTLGTMYKKDLLRMFFLVDNNLSKSIHVGFHSHNNLQLSFANAQELLQINTTREIIIDSSVFGMGRGAGNLNTELITQYINDNMIPRYNNVEILEILDQYIKPLRLQYQWGYDAPYYVSAVANCHPNYAAYLMSKQTLRVQDIHSILHKLDVEKRALFDREYICQQYTAFMNNHVDDAQALETLRDRIAGRKVLLVAPGKSVTAPETISKVRSLSATGEYAAISVNFHPADFPVDLVFVSNLKRFGTVESLCRQGKEKFAVVVTSNITTDNIEDLLVVDYLSYTNQEPIVMDNAGLMCMNLLRKLGVQELVLVGFDGFKNVAAETFAHQSMYVDVEQGFLMNEAMSRHLVQLNSQMKITFLTDSDYRM